MSQLKLPLVYVVEVGILLPIGLAVLDHWLLAREYTGRRDTASVQAMAAFVVQVGLYGILCGCLIEPPWLRWLLFAWCLLFTDLSAASSLNDRIPQSLFTAQIGLVTVWGVLGTASWKIRLPVVLLLVLPMLAMISQTAALCLICLVMRSQRYRLAPCKDEAPANPYIATEPKHSEPLQFGIKDLLLWTTALAPLLAVSRVGAWQQLTEGTLNALVLVIALWATLGYGSAWLRWSLLALGSLIVGASLAEFEMYNRAFRWNPGTFWSLRWQLHFFYWYWDSFAGIFLAAGMLAATLLIFRVLGYRLCRLRFPIPDSRLLPPGPLPPGPLTPGPLTADPDPRLPATAAAAELL